MIKGTFRLGGEYVEVIVKQDDILFANPSLGMFTTVEGLKISKEGVLREFPDLEEDINWKEKAIQRLKEHTKKLKDENSKLNYIKDELVKFGYEARFKQKAGWRPQRF